MTTIRTQTHMSQLEAASERKAGQGTHREENRGRQARVANGFALHRLHFAEVFTLAAALYRAKHA